MVHKKTVKKSKKAINKSVMAKSICPAMGLMLMKVSVKRVVALTGFYLAGSAMIAFFLTILVYNSKY